MMDLIALMLIAAFAAATRGLLAICEPPEERRRGS